MDADAIWAVLFFSALATSLFLRIRRRGRPRIYITDYQCGLRYVDGVFEDQVGPGSYGTNGSKKQITVVDLRPRLVVVERIFYQDALQSPAVISVGAKLIVQDAYTAVTRLKDATADSVAIVRDTIRLTASKSIASHSAEERIAAAAEIEKTANAELQKVGMGVFEIEITEAWSRPVEPRMTSGAN
jgi:hypothetical protein